MHSSTSIACETCAKLSPAQAFLWYHLPARVKARLTGLMSSTAANTEAVRHAIKEELYL